MAYGPGEQNLGWTPEDDSAAVGANRQKFLDGIAGEGRYRLRTVRQIHGGVVHDLTGDEDGDTLPADPRLLGHPSEAPPRAASRVLEGDGMITAQPGQLLGIVTADCFPLLLVDRKTRVVAALHAGWRCTLARIAETGVNLLRSRHGSRPEDLMAAIGPGIHPCCFEVGPDVRQAFGETFGYAAELFTPGGSGARQDRFRFDLGEANRRQLLASGLAANQIYMVAECTSCSRDGEGRRRYFSYRAEGGVTGRMLSVIGTI